MSEERVHHCYSPSKLASLEACPKFSGLRTTNLAALTGTLQHTVAETGVDNPELDDEKISAVATCLQFVDERAALYPGGQVLKEIYVPIDEEVVTSPDGVKFVGTTAGFLDIAILSADVKTAELLDMKYGKVKVESAATNPQMMAYALGLVKKFPSIEKVFVWLLQPHRDEIDGCEYYRDQFDGMRLRIRTIVNRAIEANKTPDDFSRATPTASGCLFCANVGRCPAVASIALSVGKKFAPLEIPSSVSTSIFNDPTQAALGLRIAGILKTWAEAYRTQVTAKTVEDPNFTPTGYRLTQMSKRSVVSAKKLAELAKDFLPECERDKVDELFDIPIGGLEKLISVNALRGSKEKTVEHFGTKALEEGFLKEGTPFAVLRQDTTKEKPC